MPTEARYPITFVPAGVTVWAPQGSTIIDAARAAGVIISAPCGGRGVCGKCGVKILEGNPDPPDELEKRGLSLAPPGVRLACLLRVSGALTVRPVIAQGASSVASSEETFDERVLAAVDLGTTTVEAVIFGEQTGRELGRAAVPNSQQSFGADVISRVAASEQGEAGALTRAAEESVRAALEAACTRAGACLAGVKTLVVVANSVMAASLLAEPLGSFAAHPFVSPVQEVRDLPPRGALRAELPADAKALVLPPVASFVGGDATAGLLAAGLIEHGKTSLYIDIGTNAEIAVVTPTGFTVASAAAGPALEASGVSSGGPAVPGAVRAVSYTGRDLEVDVIGGGEALWLTGSGIVSAAAALMEAGHLSPDGLLNSDGPLEQRFGHLGETLAVRIAGDEAAPVWLSQTDIRAIQTAKAAIAVGVLAVVKASRVKPKAITKVVVAGALGAAIRADDLVALGIVPSDLSGRVEQVGNAALLGAAMMAADPTLVTHAVDSLRGAAHVELAEQDGFTDRFLSALPFAPYRLKKGFS